MIKNKKAVSIAIVVLVLMTLMIVGATLYIFITHSDKIGTEVKDPKLLNDLYLREGEINFYVYDLMEKAGLKTGKSGNAVDFIKNLKSELNQYRNNNTSNNSGTYSLDFMSIIESEANENNVIVKDGKVFMNLRFKITQDYGSLNVAYIYEKEFAVDL